MDLSTACALKMVCKSNRVQEIMLTMYKDEVRAFARKNLLFFNHISSVPPMDRCRMRRGGGRCRGTPSELALTQMCAYHQERHTGDLSVNNVRCMSASNPGLFRRLVLCRTLAPALTNGRLQVVGITEGNYGPYFYRPYP